MPKYPILSWLAMIGFGLLVAFVGLIWVANLFGVADEHARRIAESQWKRGWFASELDAREKLRTGSQVGRYVAGVGFMLTGVAIAISAAFQLFAGAGE
ncbi:hypothetical protein AB0J86_26265 [Micromonospora sp. NPDC049559]|uniref:hypothetical protein n=1 Tax=Micromonospora sp. NPDC049559 TaxID=3155923 RepID=UPI00343F7FF6